MDAEREDGGGCEEELKGGRGGSFSDGGAWEPKKGGRRGREEGGARSKHHQRSLGSLRQVLVIKLLLVIFLHNHHFHLCVILGERLSWSDVCLRTGST